MTIGGLGADNTKMSPKTSVEVHASPPFLLPPMDVLIGAVTVTTPDGILLLCARTLCYKFDNTTGKWPIHSDLPHLRIRSGAVSLTSGTYLLGGQFAEKGTSLFLAKGSTTWETGPNIPRGGFCHSCVAKWTPTTFVIIGNIKKDTTQVIMYDEVTKDWTDWADLPEPGLGSHACIKVGGRAEPAVLVTGGTQPVTGTTSVADALAQKAIVKTFKLHRNGDVSDAGDLVTWSHHHAMTVLDDKVVVVGGRSGQTVHGSIQQWDQDRKKWSRVSPGLKESRYGHALAIFP